MPETRGLLWFRRAALAATLLCVIVVVVGAWVRLTNAGLGCPDWPGCYGHVHPAQAAERVAEINAANPDRPFDYQKAINEMVHRYIVGALGLLVIGLAVFSVVNRRDPAQPRVLPWLLVALLGVQALLGMWTVTLLLKPLIVTLHLLGGLLTLALLWWLALPPARRELKAAERPVRRLAIAGLRRAGRADHARRLDQHQLRGRGLPRFPDLPGLFLAAYGLPECVHPLARARNRLRGRRARRAGARRDPLHASSRRLRDGDRARARGGRARCGGASRWRQSSRRSRSRSRWCCSCWWG